MTQNNRGEKETGRMLVVGRAEPKKLLDFLKNAYLIRPFNIAVSNR